MTILEEKEATNELVSALRSAMVNPRASATYLAWERTINHVYADENSGQHVCHGLQSYVGLLASVGEAPPGRQQLSRFKTWLPWCCGRCWECAENDWPRNVRWRTDGTKQKEAA